MSAKRARLLGVAIILVFIASPAWAERERASVTLDIAGRISPACAIELQPHAELGELSRAGEARVPFTLACNRPLSYELRSEQGGLRHQSVDEYLVRYTAQLELDGPQARRGRTVKSADMREAAAQDSLGDFVPFENPGHLRIRWDAPERMLAQGRYRDVLTITVVMEGQ